MKLEDYLSKIKLLSDQLNLASAPVPLEDLILITLGGLDAEYIIVVLGLNRQVGLTWEELHSEFLRRNCIRCLRNAYIPLLK